MSERKVLSVPTSQMPTPPMDNIQPDSGMDVPNGGVSFNAPVTMDAEQETNYEADFDAGVEANEEEDPKKFIQQLTGKLSQSLRKYNESLPQTDAELSKYVAGMVLKQAIEGLSQKDVSDIIDKIDTDEKENTEIDNQADFADNEGGQMPQAELGDEEMQQPMNETTASTVNPSDTTRKTAQGQIRKGGYSRKPYCTTI